VGEDTSLTSTRSPRRVALERASPDQAGLLSNLLGLYMHDMSEMFPVEVDADGVFRYEKLALYWSKPDTHFPFLIYTGGQVAGFALATRGSPASDDPSDLDVAEFFILRGHRRMGVGREAAFLLWNRIPGRWIVRVLVANSSGLSFWRRTIARYTEEQFVESRRSGTPHDWQVFTFGSGDRHG
jgi:predicted acetyltransferase